MSETRPSDVYSAALGEIVRAADVEQAPLEAVLQRLTETAARGLGVARVNVWQLEPDNSTLTCIDNFDSRTGEHDSGRTLLAADCPSYIGALQNLRTIDAIDVASDGRTAELLDGYLKPLGITTLLDAPIIRSGRVTGVVCHEHIGPIREWNNSARLFAGNVADLVALALETDSRLRAERERAELERRVRTMERFEAIGAVAGTVAHDFRNLLTAIGANAELLLVSEPGDGVRQCAEEIRDAVQRSGELCRLLLGFSGKQDLTVTPVRINVLAEEMLRLLRRGFPTNVHVASAFDQGPLVMADAGMLRQVIMNLLTNAVDAVRGNGGTVSIRTGVRDFDGEVPQRATHDWRSGPATCASVEVRDDGVGMDEATQRRIFEPFFTTKPHGHGLGLASALGTIKAHRGALDVASRPGHGTTMVILLPVATR